MGFGAIPKLHVGSYESFPVFTAEVLSCAGSGKRQPMLGVISEKQYSVPVGSARNCRFFLIERPLNRAHSSILGPPSELIDRIPYHPT